MAKTADLYVNGKKVGTVDARNLTPADKGKDYRCQGKHNGKKCVCRMYLVYCENNIELNHFASREHIEGCDHAKSGKAQKNVIDVFLDEDGICNYQDPHEPVPPGPKGPSGGGKTEIDIFPKDNTWINPEHIDTIKKLNTAALVFKETRKMGPNDYLGKYRIAELCVDEMYPTIREKDLEHCLLWSWKKCDYKNLPFKKKDGYLVLKSYIKNSKGEDIYCMVKCVEGHINDTFLKKCIGSKKDNIIPTGKRTVIYAKFKKYVCEYDNVYIVDINSRQYFITD